MMKETTVITASASWREVKYKETLEGELRGLALRRASDPSFTPSDIEAVLKHLYVMEGADWAGRGEVQDLVLSATIAAHERFLAEWGRGE